MKKIADRLLAQVDRAAQGVESPLAAMQAMFMSHIEFIAEHPGVPRLMFGELQRTGYTPVKSIVRTLLRRYGERLRRLIEEGKASGELSATLDADAATALFLGMIHGLTVQSMLSGEPDRIRHDAPAVYAVYQRGIGSMH